MNSKAIAPPFHAPNGTAHGLTWRWAFRLEILHTIMALALFAGGVALATAFGCNAYKFKFQAMALIVGLSFSSAMTSAWSMTSPLVRVLERRCARVSGTRLYLFYAMSFLRVVAILCLMVAGVLARHIWPDPFMEAPLLMLGASFVVLASVVGYQLRLAKLLGGGGLAHVL